MADMNILANDVPAEQAPAISPPTRTDDQILPFCKWVRVGKSNYVLDVLKSQRNPIFKVAVAILKNTNFFRAFTASSTIPAIYIKQFWDTMRYDTTTGIYSCQLDEQWFNLHKDILRDALQITPINNNDPFMAPPSSDAVIKYVNTLGKPVTLKNVSAMSVNDLYQPWRAILSMINMCLPSKTVGHDRTRYHVLQILWGNLRFVGKDGRKVFGIPIPNALLTDAILGAPYYGGYLASINDIWMENTGDLVGKRRKPKSPLKLVDEFADDGVPIAESRLDDEEAGLQQGIELSLKDLEARNQGPPRLVVFKEPDSRRFQPLPERRSRMTTGPSGNAESPSLDAELTNSETESDKTARSNPGKQDEGHAGSNPSNTTELQPQPSYVVHAGPNLEPMDLAVSDSSTQQNPEQIDEEFTTTAYPNVQENLKLPTGDQVIIEEPASSTGYLSSLQNLEKELSFTNQFFMKKPQEDEPEKTNAESEVQSMVTVPIHQDTSSVPPMTTPVLDLPTGELEQHMANLIQDNLALEERLNKHGSRLYNLENLNIPQKVSKAVDEIVTDAVDWAMQAPLRARFSDLLAKSLEHDYSNQLLADLDEARRKKKMKRNLPKTPSGSPLPQPPPSPPLADAFGAPAGFTDNDSIPEEHVYMSDDEDTGNDHLLKADMRKDWWKPLPEEDRPATPEPTWTIYSSNVSDVENNWATALASSYVSPAKNSLLMEECHKMLTDQITWVNPKSDQVRIDVSRPLPHGGPLGHVTNKTQFFFNKDLDHLIYENKGSRPALSISKMKAAHYPDFGLELLVPKQMWIDEVEVRKHMRILSVIRIKAFLRYGYDYLSEIVLRIADFQEHKIAEKYFKNLYPSDFEDLNLLLLQDHLDHLSGFDKCFEYKHDSTIIESPRAVVFLVNNHEQKIMRFNEMYKFNDGTLIRILEALDYRVKEYMVIGSIRV
nr:hypothetical protein [Tanacetum cinerariifolium]